MRIWPSTFTTIPRTSSRTLQVHQRVPSRDRGWKPPIWTRFARCQAAKRQEHTQIGRLTNLMQLTVDTQTGGLGIAAAQRTPISGRTTFPQAIPGFGRRASFRRFPERRLPTSRHSDVISRRSPTTLRFHFAMIEQGGSSLCPSLAQRVSDPEVLRILLSIGPTETMHFQTWQDKAGNAPALNRPDEPGCFSRILNAAPLGGEDFQTNLIVPEPTIFLRRTLPGLFDHSPDRDGRCSDGRRHGADSKRGPVPWPIAGVLWPPPRSGRGSRCSSDAERGRPFTAQWIWW